MPDTHGARTHWRGLPCLALQAANGDSALLALHGAQLLSWVSAGQERLYLSPQALADGRSAIRGGVPLCFPQFNQRGPLPKHGFARNLPWRVQAQQADGATLVLHDDEATRRLWPQGFAAQLQVQLTPAALQLTLGVHNCSASAWDFTAALHSYLRVADIGRTRLHGLDGCARWDAVADRHGRQQGAIGFDGEYDSVLQASAASLQLDGGDGLAVHITHSASWGQVVVWNPGAALCAQLPDMPADGYRQMLCVEAAQIDQRVTLAPGARWSGWQRLQLSNPAAPGPG
ncbi:D-hexose-6-phosphate mutarotase [Acidovorax sp. HDW3]|uniref:D-hexose-6-phosphate mutarotase n=1 Tax=Acidovorax sp. HDW3 TaxID=2714923 RepID=UPI00140D27E6|nr:D-hexose-6-phosphate mutarotase [Acidovorax sp. HDW3]QIL44909.1 D-hexose-6-phosphate mutarotase [Acidovorax sp. HDW3]